MVMHQLHCLRNVRRCAGCGVPFPVKELDAHVAYSAGTPAAIFAAVAGGDTARLDVVVAHGASLSAPCDAATGDAPIHAATRLRRLDVLRYLVGAGVSVNAVNGAGDTPLHVACAAASAARAAGALLAATPSTGDALDAAVGGAARSAGAAAAAATTFDDVAAFLVSAGCDVEARDALGDTPLQLAQRTHNAELALLLTSAGGSLRPVRNNACHFTPRVCLSTHPPTHLPARPTCAVQPRRTNTASVSVVKSVRHAAGA